MVCQNDVPQNGMLLLVLKSRFHLVPPGISWISPSTGQGWANQQPIPRNRPNSPIPSFFKTPHQWSQSYVFFVDPLLQTMIFLGL